jgi:hypothetical protein
MLYIIKLFIILTNIISSNSSFELGLWRGFTQIYTRNQYDNLNLSKPFVTKYNQNYTFNANKLNFYLNYNKYYDLNDNKLKLKLKSNDNFGGFYINVDKNTNINFNNEINFFHKSMRSIININYFLNNQSKYQLNYITISALRCGLVRTYKIRRNPLNISCFISELKKWNYCKSTLINPKNIYDKKIKEHYSYDYEYFFKNPNYISSVFVDKLVISIPKIIDDNKPFSMLYGCLTSEDCYKQINLNYNFNSELVSIEFNEYEPFNFSKKIDNFLENFKFKLSILKNKTISFRNKELLTHHCLL